MNWLSLLLGVGLCCLQVHGSYQRRENDFALENNQNHRHRYRRSNDMLGYSVSFEKDMSDSMKEDFSLQFQEFVVDEFEGLNFVHLHVPEAISDDVILDLKKKTYVKVIDHETAYKSYALYWNKDRIGVHEQKDIRAGNGDFEGNGFGVYIYVVDSGIDDHIEFGNRVDRATSKYFEERIDSYDCNGHGTRVAGIAAGKYTGVATQAILVSYAIMDCNHKQTGALAIEKALAKIKEDKDNFPDRKIVINLSLGPASHMNSSFALQSIEEELTDIGVIIIRAAGNSDDDACLYGQNNLEHSISVGSTSITDEMSEKSNYGSCVDILAPGENVPFPKYSELTHSSRDYGYGSGTSFAAPLVSGVAAVMMQKTFSDGKRVIPYILGNATIGAIKNIAKKDPSNTTPNKFLYLKKVPEFVGKKKWTMVQTTAKLQCQDTVGVASPFYPSGADDKLTSCKRTAFASGATGFNMDVAETLCYFQTCEDDIKEYDTTGTTTYKVYVLEDLMVPKHWISFKSSVKGALSCPEVILLNPHSWPFEADIDTYQKKTQRCKEEATLMEASGFNFDNTTNKCSIRKCSGSRTYDTSSPLVDVFEFAETKQGRFKYAKNVMQGLGLKCHRADGGGVWTDAEPSNYQSMKDVNSLEGCANLASTNGLNSFNYELTSGNCYAILCDTVYQEYSDDRWESPPGNYLLFTAEESVPQQKDGFSIDDGFGNQDTVLFCNNTNSSSYIIQNAKSIVACIDIAMFTNADALNYDANTTTCQLMSCPDEYTVIDAPVPGNWFYYRHFTIKKDRITTNGFRFVPLERSRVLGSTCTNLTAETDVYSENTESCSQMAALVNANAFQYSQNKECVCYSCVQSAGSSVYKTFTEDRLTDDYASYFLTYAAPLLVPEIYKGYELKTFTGTYTSTKHKLVCESFQHIVDVTLEECSFFTSVSNGNAFNYRRIGVGKCEPKLCHEIETEVVSEDDWLMYVDEERMNPSQLILVTLTSNADYSTFESRYPDDIIELSVNTVDDDLINQVIMNITSVLKIESLQNDNAVASIESYQVDDREVSEVFTEDTSPAQDPIVLMEVNKLTGAATYKSGSKGYDHEIEVKNPIKVAAPGQMNAFTRGSFTNIMDTFSVSGGFGQLGATSYDIRTGGSIKHTYSPYNGIHAMGGGMIGYSDVYTEAGVTDINGGFGLTNMNGGWGVTDLNAAFGMTDLNGGWGITDLNAGWGRTDINGAWGVTDLNGGFGVTDLNAAWGQTDLNGGWGQTNLNGGWGMTDLNGGWGATDLNAGWGLTDLNGGWGRTDLNGGFGLTDLNGGWGVSLLHGDYGYPGLNGDYSYKDIIGSSGLTDLNGMWEDSGSGYGAKNDAIRDIYNNDDDLDVVALADMFKRHSIGEIDVTNWVFDDTQTGPIIKYNPVSTSSFPMLVKSHSKTFKYVPNLERDQHLYCTGERVVLFDVISIQDCAIRTNSSEYNGFSYSVASKICKLETCENNVYSTVRSAIGFVTYVRVGIYPAKSKDFTFLPFNSFGRLGCKETIDESTIFENMASVETCLATAVAFTDPAVNFKYTTGQCEIITCKDDLHDWIVTNERDLLVYTRVDRVHPKDISYRAYKSTSTLGGLADSYQNVAYEDNYVTFPLSETTYADDMGRISFELFSKFDDTFDIEIECKKVNYDSSVIVQTGALVEDLIPEYNTYYNMYTSKTGMQVFTSINDAHQHCLLDHECIAITESSGGTFQLRTGVPMTSPSNEISYSMPLKILDQKEDQAIDGIIDDERYLSSELAYLACKAKNTCKGFTKIPENSFLLHGSENIALGKPVKQSSYYGSDVESSTYSPLTDGHPYHAHSSCHDESPWMEIDLQGEYFINEIVIYIRPAGCCPERLKGFQMQLFNNEGVETYFYDYSLWNKVEEAFYQKLLSATARFVRISLPGKTQCLDPSEISVFGVPSPNVALHKHVKQSDYYRGATESSFSFMTDGIVDGNSAHASCTDHDPWFEIDLEVDYFVDEIIIYARDKWAIRLVGFHIQLFNNERVETESYDYSLWNEIKQSYYKRVNSRARYLRISLPGQIGCLNVGEISVHGTPASTANIALHKHVKQSDYYGGAVESSFSYLTDGKIINVSAHSSCVDVSPWFEVDLAKEYMLTEIVIHARPNWASRLEGFHMQLFDNKRIETDSYDYSDWNEVKESYHKRVDSRARYLRISLPGRTCLNVAELIVYGNVTQEVNSIIGDSQRQQMMDDIDFKRSIGYVIQRVDYGADSGCTFEDITYEFKSFIRDSELLDTPHLYLDQDLCPGVAKSVYIKYENGCVQESDWNYANYYYGDDTYYFDKVWQCARECSLNRGCMFYTYTPSSRLCEFKFKDKGRRRGLGTISGTSCELYEYDVFYDGDDISIMENIESPYRCNAECNTNYECNYWTHDGPSEKCHLKKGLFGQSIVVGAVSGKSYGYYSLRSGSLISSPGQSSWLLTDVEPNSAILQPTVKDGEFHWEKVPGSFTHAAGRNKMEIITNKGDLLMRNIRLTGDTFIVNSVLSKFRVNTASDATLIGGNIELVNNNYFTIQSSIGYASDLSTYLLPSIGKATFIIWAFTDSSVSVDILCHKATTTSSMYVYLGPTLNNYDQKRTIFSPETNKACIIEQDTTYGDNLLDGGNSVSFTGIDSVDICSHNCFAYDGCFYFTYDSNSKTCYYKASGDTKATSSGLQSGRACDDFQWHSLEMEFDVETGINILHFAQKDAGLEIKEVKISQGDAIFYQTPDIKIVSEGPSLKRKFAITGKLSNDFEVIGNYFAVAREQLPYIVYNESILSYTSRQFINQGHDYMIASPGHCETWCNGYESCHGFDYVRAGEPHSGGRNGGPMTGCCYFKSGINGITEYSGALSYVKEVIRNGNVALGKPTTASAAFKKDFPFHAVDGSLLTKFVSSGEVDNFLTVDLERSYYLTSISLFNQGLEELSNFNVQLLDDSSNEVYAFSQEGGYTRYSTGGCISRTELGTFDDQTLRSCRLKCEQMNDCISFTVAKDKSGYCALSTSCDYAISVQDETNKNFLFVKQGLTGGSAPVLENIALGKPVKQSSYYGDDVESSTYSPLTDGGTYHAHSSCHDESPWMEIDLQGEYFISEVVIDNRVDCCQERIIGFEMQLFNDRRVETESYNYAIWNEVKTSYDRKVGSTARYVRFSLPGKTECINLAEISVYGTPASENIALSKPVKQSSYYGGEVESSFSYLVDGSLGNQAHSSCHDGSPWMEIDLQGEYFINEIIIYNRISQAHRIIGFKMQLLNNARVETESYDYSIWNEVKDHYYRQPTSTARYLRISLPGRTECLNIAEISVRGTSAPNIALHKPVKQSDYYKGASESSYSFMNDGIIVGESAHSSCNDVSPWFEMDLQGEYILKEIIIYPRERWQSRVEGFHMQLLDQERTEAESYDYSEWNELRKSYYRQVNCKARYVRISLPGRTCLNVAELSVYGRPASLQEFTKTLPAPIEARYIRVNQPTGFLHISNLEAYALQENVALWKPTSASAAISSEPVRHIVDGQRNTRFLSATDDSSWLELDLTEEKTIRGLLLYTDSDANVLLADFVVTFLNTAREDVGGTFTNVDNPELSDFIWKIFDKPLENVRYVRLHRNPQTSSLQLYEIEVFETENIALGKMATSTAPTEDWRAPDMAIDDDANTRFLAYNTWFNLDLGKEFYIDSIEIVNSNELDRLDGFLVEVMDSTGRTATTFRHSDFNDVTQASYNLLLDTPALGQYIRISRPGNLQIYELKVFGSERKGKCSVMHHVQGVGTPCRNDDGTDHYIRNVESTETCSRLCLWDSECNAYNYFENDKNCYFLTDIISRNNRYPSENVFSGFGCEFEQDIGLIDYDIWALVPGLIRVDLEVTSNFTASSSKPSVDIYVLNGDGKIYNQGTIQPSENNGHWTWFAANQLFNVSTGANTIRVVQKDAGLLIRGVRIASGEAFFLSDKSSIKVVGETPDGIQYLSGSNDPLGLSDSATAKWKFAPVGGTYNIIFGEQYLSASVSDDIVRLAEASNSDLQRWSIEKISGSNDRYRIGVVNDRTGERNYLSVDADGNNVQLVQLDINSQRQKWVIDPGALQHDPDAVVSIIKYHSTVQIKGDQFSSKIGAISDIDYYASRKFQFTSVAAGNVPFADLYVRPAVGVTKTPEECLRWGEQIVLAYTEDIGYTKNGWYGSRVAQIDDDGILFFFHGKESPATFRLQPVVGFNSASTRCVRRGDAAYLVADLGNPDSTVEDSVNGPWGTKVARVSDENFLEFVYGSGAETLFFR